MWNSWKRFAATAPARKRLLGEALLSLVLARVAMACMPFRRIAAWLGKPGIETPVSAPAEAIDVAKDIGWAVGVLARRVPWDSRCLAQALAATFMLRQRGLEGTVSFVGDKDASAQLTAHAWLRFGPFMVTGGPGYERFRIFTTFARRKS